MTTLPSVACGTGWSLTTSRSSRLPCLRSSNAFIVLVTSAPLPPGLLNGSSLSSLASGWPTTTYCGRESLEMKENFRQFLDRLRQAGELVDLHQAVDIRHIATLVDQAKTALYFHKVIGYDMPGGSGIIPSKERATKGPGRGKFGESEGKV